MRITIELTEKEHIDAKVYAARNRTTMGRLGKNALLGAVYGHDRPAATPPACSATSTSSPPREPV